MARRHGSVLDIRQTWTMVGALADPLARDVQLTVFDASGPLVQETIAGAANGRAWRVSGTNGNRVWWLRAPVGGIRRLVLRESVEGLRVHLVVTIPRGSDDHRAALGATIRVGSGSDAQCRTAYGGCRISQRGAVTCGGT